MLSLLLVAFLGLVAREGVWRNNAAEQRINGAALSIRGLRKLDVDIGTLEIEENEDDDYEYYDEDDDAERGDDAVDEDAEWGDDAVDEGEEWGDDAVDDDQE
jgi:hypothetical protein